MKRPFANRRPVGPFASKLGFDPSQPILELWVSTTSVREATNSEFAQGQQLAADLEKLIVQRVRHIDEVAAAQTRGSLRVVIPIKGMRHDQLEDIAEDIDKLGLEVNKSAVSNVEGEVTT